MQLVILWAGYGEEDNQISILRYLDSNVVSIRDRYSHWIDSIGNSVIDGRTIADWLTLPNGHNLWLMSGVFEKSLYKHPYLVDCLKLFALEEILINRRPVSVTIKGVSPRIFAIIKEMTDGFGIQIQGEMIGDEIALSIKHRIKKLFFSLPYFAQGVIWFSAYCFRHFSLRKSKIDNETFDPNNTVFVFSYFIHLDRAGLENGQFISGHWDQLPALVNREGYHIHFLHHFLLSSAVKSTSEGIRFLSLLNTQAANENLHQFIDSRISLAATIKTIRSYFRIKMPIKKTKRFFASDRSKLNVWPILSNEWRSSVCGYTAFQNLLWIQLIDDYFDHPVKYKRGFYLQENQGWERAFVHAWRRHGHHTLVAVQHGIVREWDIRYFNFLPTTNAGEGFNIPEPDLYAINGPAAYNTLSNAGLETKHMMPSEALRYNELLDTIALQNTEFDTRNDRNILLLGDYHILATLKMLEAVQNAAKTLDCELNFTLKCHPACPVDVTPYQASIKISVIQDQLFKILPGYNCVIATGATTAALDAYIAGASVQVFLENDNINLSPLKGVKNVSFATEVADVVKFLSMVHHHSEKGTDNRFFWLDKDLRCWKKILDKVK